MQSRSLIDGHLLHSLSEALTSALQPHHRILMQTAHAIRELEAPPPAVPPAVHVEPRAALVKSQNRDRRHSRYEQGWNEHGVA